MDYQLDSPSLAQGRSWERSHAFTPSATGSQIVPRSKNFLISTAMTQLTLYTIVYRIEAKHVAYSCLARLMREGGVKM